MDERVGSRGAAGAQGIGRHLIATMAALVVIATSGVPAAASGPELVADLDPRGAGSVPGELVRSGDRVFFIAGDEDHGRELWVSDGTSEGTRLVKDVEPGPAGSAPENLTDADGALFFVDHRRGTAFLWRSDGSDAGTYRVGPIPLADSADLVGVGTSVVFMGRDRDRGAEPWFSDGTPAGTRPLLDIWPGRGSSWPDVMVPSGGLAYFLADDHVHGEQVWRTDGTSVGTFRLTDFGGDGAPTLTAVGDRLFVFTRDPSTGLELWTSDGTVEGTRLAARIDPGSEPRDSIVAAGGRLAFMVDSFERDASELWISDGTVEGTHRVATLEDLSGGLVPAGDLVYLVGSRNIEADDRSVLEVWRSDGTSAGTFRLRAFPGEAGWPNPIAVGGSLYFVVDDGVHGTELWTSDGTEQGTRLVDDVWPGPKSSQPWNAPSFAALDDVLLFAAEEPEHRPEIWRTDGTESGTRLVRDIRTGGASSGIGEPVAQGRHLWFVTPYRGFDDLDRYDGPVIWRTDGTGRGTRRVIHGGEILSTAGQGPYALTALGRRVSFFVSSLDNMSLGLSDGSPAGTKWVGYWFNPSEPWCYHGTLALRRVLYAGCDPGLLRSDGTRKGTSYLLRVRRDREVVSGLVGLGGRVYFLVERGHWRWWQLQHESTALWGTDGTRRGTQRIIDFDLGPAARTGLTSARGRLYFSYPEPSQGREPWISDGTAAGTQRLTAIRPGPQGSSPRGFAPAPGGVWLSADDGTRGREPWMTDGTASGTRLLLDVRAGRRGSDPTSGVRVGDRLFFAASDGRHGRELWVTDGTPPGTRLVRDLTPGRADSSPIRLTRVGDQIIFVAGDRMGAEFWRSDGTARGTRRVADLRPGEKGSDPEHLVATTDAVYFTADDGRHGRELGRYAP